MASPKRSQSISPSSLEHHYGRQSIDSVDKAAGPRPINPQPIVSEDITVPPNLLRGASRAKEWDQGHQQRKKDGSQQAESSPSFRVADIVREQQEIVELVKKNRRVTHTGLFPSDALGSADHCLATTGRRTSLPTSPTHARHRQHSPQDGHQSGQHAGSIAPHALTQTTEPMLSTNHNDHAVLFRSLNSYALKGEASRRHRSLSIQIAPDADFLSTLRIPETQETIESERGPDTESFDDTIDSSEPQDPSVARRLSRAVTTAYQAITHGATDAVRKSSLYDQYEKAKARSQHLQRKKWVQILFECTFYLLILCFIYFVLVGRPIWNGAVRWLYWVINNKFTVAGTWSITIGMALFYAYAPLLIFFDDEPSMVDPQSRAEAGFAPEVTETALLIPCYKAAKIIGPTLSAARKIFPPQNIFVIANGNSPTPLDDTESICREHGVNHVWSPIGSKIVAQYVGCHAARQFTNVLLIDDDCALPPNFPIVSGDLKGKVKCIGYTIKSVGPGSSKGTLCQQAQDLEYKTSGLQRAFAGKIGSATFPHGAISLWNTSFLIDTFKTHPGFSVSEDWFFGHAARKLGSRIKMNSAIFVETETPSAVLFPPRGGARGGFGEMTIFKQRFYRWNFFFVNGMFYNTAYILGSWKLGFWELGAKIFVFQEVYETLLYLLAPFVLPISLVVRPAFCGYLLVGTLVLYFVNVTIFNEIHLRRRNERVSWTVVYLYYTPYKILLTCINVFSCYYSLWKYARYFAKRHPKIVEDEKAIEVVLRLEEASRPHSAAEGGDGAGARRLTVTAVGSHVVGPEIHQRASVINPASIIVEENGSTDEAVAAADDINNIERRRSSGVGREGES